MLTVTKKAQKILESIIRQGTTEPNMAIRMCTCPEKTNQMELVLDRKKEGDQVIKNEDRMNLLLIEPELSLSLENLVLDYQETPQGSGFILSKFS